MYFEAATKQPFFMATKNILPEKFVISKNMCIFAPA